jgi:hypothetical protein
VENKNQHPAAKIATFSELRATTFNTEPLFSYL